MLLTASLRFLAVCAVCLGTSARVAAADVSVVVLGLRSVEGDDEFANNMTVALRAAAKSVEGWRLLERSVSMSQMVLAHNCDEVDAACLTDIARGLEAERVVFGTVRRTGPPSKYNYEVSVSLFNAGTRAITAAETQTVERSESKKGLGRYAQSISKRLASAENGVGKLALEVNVLSADVKLDGQIVGQTQDQKLVLDSVAPGEHTLEVSAPGHQPYQQTIQIRASEQAIVSVMLERVQEVEEAVPVSPEAVAATTPEPAAREGSSLTWLGFTLVGVGAASAIAWGASMYMIEFQYNRNETYQRYKNSYQIRTEDACDAALSGDNAGNRLDAAELADFQSRCRTGRTFQVLQWVFLGAAVVAAGTGVYVLISESGKSDASTTAKLQAPRFMLEPQVGRREVALQATLRF